jgi:signal transduction histidine kinase
LINSQRIFFCLLTLLFISCTKDKLSIYVQKNQALFDKSYIDKLHNSKKEAYLDSIVALLKFRKNDSITRKDYLKVSSEFYYLNKYKKSLKTSLIALKLSEEANDKNTIPTALYYIGDCYQTSKKDSAFFYYLKAEKLYYNNHDDENVGRMLLNKAYVLFYDGNYLECQTQLSKALKYLRKSKKMDLIYCCNNMMGNCLEKLTYYDSALKYHKLALVNVQEMKANHFDTALIKYYNMSSLVNICNLYDLKKEYSKSIEILKKLTSLELRKKSPEFYGKVISNLAYSKMKIGDFRNVKSMFLESLKIADSIGNESEILYRKLRLGEYFLLKKDTVNTMFYLLNANKLAIKIQNNNEILSSLALLQKADSKNGLRYANEYIKISDSLNLIQKKSYDKYARIEYETSRVENENADLSKKNFIILIISFVLLLFFVCIIFWRSFKHKNRELLLLKMHQNANDDLYQLMSEQQDEINLAKQDEKIKIAKELHDGIMNKIYAVRMNLGVLNSKTSQETIEKRRDFIFELQNIENEIRDISHALNHKYFFDKNDFDSLISNFIKTQENISAVKFKYSRDENLNWSDFPNIFRINLYRIIQEAILNVNKHSNASECEIQIFQSDTTAMNLFITDNGEGFGINTQKKGIGLNNISERVNLLKGKLDIESKKGKGTKIKIVFF